MQLLKENRAALIFLGRFLGIYLLGNILYGLWVEGFGDRPDPATRVVSMQSASVLRGLGYALDVFDHPSDPKVSFVHQGKIVLNVFEGCNGINVAIVFIAFLVAFGGPPRTMLVFIIAGLAGIHLFNLFRILLLYDLSLNNPRQFYYYHKYFFTATLYLIVFVLWALWIFGVHGKKRKPA